MSHDVDTLFLRWQSHKDTATTLALCDALRGRPRPEILTQVGDHVLREMGSNVVALLATARLFLESSRLAEAQSTLVAAGKVAPRDAAVYRWLGEVLLRRGDAERAEKVLGRAAHFGANDALLGTWLTRSRQLVDLQKSEGQASVAKAVAQRFPVRSTSLFDIDDDQIETRAYSRTDVTGKPPAVQSRGALPVPSARPSRPPPPSLPPPSRRATAIAPATPPSRPPPSATSAARLPAAPSTPPPRREVSRGLDPSRLPPPRPLGAAADTSSPQQEQSSLQPAAPRRADLLETDRVLQELARTGVFEAANEKSSPTWEAAPRTGGGLGRLVALLAVLAVGAASLLGGTHWTQSRRAEEGRAADALLDSFEARLGEMTPDELAALGPTWTRVFALQPRSGRAARAWLHERALHAIYTGDTVGLEEARQRAIALGVADESCAFVSLAHELVDGNLELAAQHLEALDADSLGDAYHALFAGLVLDPTDTARALTFYHRAYELDPSLRAAAVWEARARIMAAPTESAAVIEGFEGAARERDLLVALAWTVNPARKLPAPEELARAASPGPSPPKALAVLPEVLHALGALEAKDTTRARTALDTAVDEVDGPRMALWLGNIAIDAGLPTHARRAAQRVLASLPSSQPARSLLARAALLDGQLDRDLDLDEVGDPANAEIVKLGATTAYERALPERLDSLWQMAGPSLQRSVAMAGLGKAREVLLGAGFATPEERRRFGQRSSTWADMVAMDSALDFGDMETAEALGQRWSKHAPLLPHHALRLARLARYQGDLERAETLSAQALARGPQTARAVIERCFILVALRRSDEALRLTANVGGPGDPRAAWLEAIVLAAAGRSTQARTSVSSASTPDEHAAYIDRLLALSASAALHDTRRGGELIRAMIAAGQVNPDVRAAAERLHMPALR